MGLNRKKVIISRLAQESILEIHAYLKKKSTLETARYVKANIIAKCKSLSAFSGYSEERFLKKLDGNYKSVTIWSYVIVFSQTDKEIRILNVIHSSRHPDKRKRL